MKAVLELLLRDIRLTARPQGKARSRHVLTATLLWPRPLIAQRQAVRDVTLVDGHADLAQQPWTERVLFKENVEGRFGILLSLSDALTDAALERVLRAVASEAIKAQGALLAGELAGGVLPVALWTAPLSVLARDVARPSDPAAFARGAIDAASEQAIPPTGETSGLWTVPLVAARDVTRTSRQRRAGKLRTIRRVVHTAGEPLGEATLERLGHAR